MRTIRTMCPMNCHPTLCGMLADIEDDKLLGLRGDPDNPDSEGFLCVRGRAAAEIIGNPLRLTTPLMRDRRGRDDWRAVDWDTALDYMASAMALAGPERVGIWPGHGNIANSYGVYLGAALAERFANLYGCQYWSPAMICWGLGGFGLGLTGALATNTKEDMGAHSNLIILWGANLPSQPNTARHLVAARDRGAKVITIDVRRSEAAAQSDETLLIRPGTDAALALAVMHVLIGERLCDRDFIAAQTVGFDALSAHVAEWTPARAAAITGIEPDRIAALACAYATTKPAMILVGGSSLHKGANGWQAARAISCLPALVGSYGRAGGGLGPRHGSTAFGAGLADITAAERRRPGKIIPQQMSAITSALCSGEIDVLLLPGANMMSSFADVPRLATGLDRTGLIVCHDLFMTETARRYADIVLPATAWLEDVGAKRTHTHVYLMERGLEPAGDARPVQDVLRGLATRLGVEDFYPWADQDGVIDAILDHPSTGRATTASMRANGGRARLEISHVAYPDGAFDTPSGKIEFHSERAAELGLPPLPDFAPAADAAAARYPLTLAQGRTLTHFHSFYDQGRALPTLAARDPAPRLWLSEADAAARGIADGDPVRVFNERGEFTASAFVTDRLIAGTIWMHDGWSGLNNVTGGEPVLPDAATTLFAFTVGQSSFAARVDVAPA